jgi:hypothetical protein
MASMIKKLLAKQNGSSNKSEGSGGGGGEGKQMRTKHDVLSDSRDVLKSHVYASSKAINSSVSKFLFHHPNEQVNGDASETMILDGLLSMAAIQEVTEEDKGAAAWNGLVASIESRTAVNGATISFHAAQYMRRRGEDFRAYGFLATALPKLKDPELRNECERQLKELSERFNRAPTTTTTPIGKKLETKEKAVDSSGCSNGSNMVLKDGDVDQCAVCMMKPYNVVAVPCAHLAMCEECMNILHQQANPDGPDHRGNTKPPKCPVCRAAVELYIVCFPQRQDKQK